MDSTVVNDIMHHGVITCRPDASLREVVRILGDQDVTAIVVVGEAGEMLGLISHTDILEHYGEDLSERHAQQVMTTDVYYITRQTPISVAVARLLEKRVHRLIVADETDAGLIPAGVLSTTDVIRHLRGARWAWRWD